MSSLQQRVGRITGMTLFTGMLGFQLYLLKGLLGQSVHPLAYVRWGLITTLFALFLSSYVIRRPAVGEARRIREILLPLFCAGLPIATLMLSEHIHHLYHHAMESGWKEVSDWIAYLFRSQWSGARLEGLSVMAFGEIITIGGMLTLRGSFSIFSEARKVVSSGLYRFVRHPLYTGEIISLWGYVMFWPSIWTISLTFLFTVTQSMRAKVEEAKLIESFPDYANYRKEVGFLLPKPRAFFKKAG